MTQQPKLAVGGENLIDHVTRDGEVTALPGGSPFNVAMAMGRQGADVHYATPISSDDWGVLLADTLSASGVTLSGGRSDAPTTMARVTVTDGLPSYKFERDGTAERQISQDQLEAALPSDLTALHIGSLALTSGGDADLWETFCATQYETGRTICLDPNIRLSFITDMDSYRERMHRMFGKTHVLKLSDEDLEGLYAGATEEEALSQIAAHSNARITVLTRGPDGASAWLQDGTRIDIQAPPVPDLVDTVGAGDTFMATLNVALAEGGYMSDWSSLTAYEAQRIITRSAAAAAINCTRAGCNPPTRAELDAALA